MMAWLALVLSLVSLGVAGLAVAACVRGARALAAGRGADGPAVILPAVDRADASVLRTVAAVLPGATIAVPCLPVHHALAETLAEVRRAVPGAALSALPSPVPPRHVARPWLEAHAARGVPARSLLLLDERAEPVARSLPLLLAAVAGYDLVAACPVPSRSGGPGRLAARVVQEVVPLLAAACGPSGLPALETAVSRAAVDRALADPLTPNRPSLAAAVAAGSDRTRALLVPCAVGLAARRAGAVLREQAAPLARRHPVGVLAVVVALLAVPSAVAALAFSSGSRLVAVAALVLALGARAAVALAWTRAIRGLPPAVVSVALSPLLDAIAALGLAAAAIPGRLRHGGVLFRARKGGTLAPE